MVGSGAEQFGSLNDRLLFEGESNSRARHFLRYCYEHQMDPDALGLEDNEDLVCDLV